MTSQFVINEVSTNVGGPTQEGIELLNNLDTPLNIGGATLRMVTPSILVPVEIATVPLGTVLPVGGRYLVHGRNFLLPVPLPAGCAAQEFNRGVSLPDELSIGLFNAQGVQIDGFGTVERTELGGLFTEGDAAAVQVDTRTNQRIPNGNDTDDNAADFRLRAQTFCLAN